MNRFGFNKGLMSSFGFSSSGGSPASSFEPETIAFLNTLGVANDSTVYLPATAFAITGTALWTATNNLTLAYKTFYSLPTGVNNLSTKIPYIYPRILGTALSCSCNLVTGTYTATYYGGWSYTGAGAFPNGINSYMDSGYCYNRTNFTITNHQAGITIKTNNNTAGSDFGTITSATADIILNARNGSDLLTRIGDDVTLFIANGNALGNYIISRVSSANYKWFKNGTLLGTPASPSSALAIPNDPLNNILYGARYNNGVVGNYINRGQSVIFAGQSSTVNADIQTLDAAISSFEIALNR